MEFLLPPKCPLEIRGWSREWELNPRPADYESAALPLSYLGFSSSYGLFRELPTAICVFVAFSETFAIASCSCSVLTML